MRRHLLRELLINSGLMALIAIAWYFLGFGWGWIIAPIWIPILRDIQTIIHRKLKKKDEQQQGYKD
jgi:hypothetical protein